MNNEIKEILDNLDFNINHTKGWVEPLGLNQDTWKILLDYITNLQQENERLKDSIDWWKDRFFGQQEYDDSHRITAIEYKKRIDKAIEYINTHDDCFYQEKGLNEDSLNELLNILQNRSEEK